MNGNAGLYALLIGIDHYLPNHMYDNLGGCVPDIARVEGFLKAKLGLAADQLIKLTATDVGAGEPPEPKKQWPTYENMVAAFKRVTDTAQPGDQVYIHYSGHGGRQETDYPDLKGQNAKDEGLVPMDIGTSQYLLDVELAYILKAMVDKGLVVTMVLDSCHSGGATRGKGKASVRGVSAVDKPRGKESQVASTTDLAANWRAATKGQPRAMKLAGGWLPEPEGYVLLAACRAHEYANEYEVEPGLWGGALTYQLLNTLKQIGPRLTYKMVHSRVLAQVHSTFSDQTPQLQGEGDRVVFGSATVQMPPSVRVEEVDEANDQVLLATGQAQGVRVGAQFAIYPPEAALAEEQARLAVVTVNQLGGDSSWAKITGRDRDDAIEPGAQAALIDPGSVRLQRTVVLFERDDLDAAIDQAAALQRVRDALAPQGKGWVVQAGAGEKVDYQVVVDEPGAYEIWDPAGRPVPNLRPALKIDGQDAASQVVQRIVHLAKYHNIAQLDNYDDTSPLANALEIELMGLQPDFQPGDPMELTPLYDPGGTPTLETGTRVVLRIKNTASQPLNVTVLDLQPDWGISQLYPAHGDYETLDPGDERKIRIRPELPPGYGEGTDLLKVFATVGDASYKWLELPVLDQPPVRGAALRAAVPTNPLEALLAALTDEQESKGLRNMGLDVDPSHEWIMAQVEVHTKKANPG